MNQLAVLGYRLLASELTVAIRDCVHYCAFRYGRGEFNPYESCARSLAAGEPAAKRRAEFEDFVKHYRPRTLGAALGIELSQAYPLWWFPWRARTRASAWVERPADVVDVMTHFSPRGVPSSLVEREFHWHEQAFARMSQEGYRPGLFAHARVLVLQGETRAAYLLTDGNHRVSALSALGVQSLRVLALRGRSVRRDRVDQWPLVRSGRMPRADALAIFDAYHRGNQAPPRSEPAAPLV